VFYGTACTPGGHYASPKTSRTTWTEYLKTSRSLFQDGESTMCNLCRNKGTVFYKPLSDGEDRDSTRTSTVRIKVSIPLVSLRTTRYLHIGHQRGLWPSTVQTIQVQLHWKQTFLDIVDNNAPMIQLVEKYWKKIKPRLLCNAQGKGCWLRIWKNYTNSPEGNSNCKRN